MSNADSAVLDPDIDPDRFAVQTCTGRGFAQAYVRVNPGGVPLLCVHGWPESKRIFWKVIQPLAEAGFEVIVPDLRGFGDSEVGPDGFHDVTAHSHDLHALAHDHLGHDRVVVLGGDLGGPVIQDLALRHPDWVDRMVLFNSPLPYLKDLMADIAGTRAPREASDYFVRQGTDPDGLAAEMTTAEQRRHYIATFYTSRFWGHPGSFAGDGVVDFHTEPFGDAASMRASFGGYESAFDPAKSSGRAMIGHNPVTPTLVLYGTSDHVMYPAFDRMAAKVFDRHVGPFLLRDCGHFVPWEAPHALASGTIAFCGDLLASAGS
jgi:pimeloyl-ACP methyl ester carboxylesterase